MFNDTHVQADYAWGVEEENLRDLLDRFPSEAEKKKDSCDEKCYDYKTHGNKYTVLITKTYKTKKINMCI